MSAASSGDLEGVLLKRDLILFSNIEKGGEDTMDLKSLEGLKDATPEDIRLAQEVEDAEKKQGIPHPEIKND